MTAKPTWRIAALFLLFLPFFAQALDEADLLSPEEAFQLSSEPTAGGVLLHWDVADGYYLYRSKFRVTPETSGVTVGEIEFPASLVKDDPYFGSMDIYRGRVTLRVPLQARNVQDAIPLRVSSQGCADAGLCYPPQYQTVNVEITGAPVAKANPLAALADLGRSLNAGAGEADEFLPSDEAFRFTAETQDDGRVRLRWDIADGYYLYRDKFKIESDPAAGAVLGTPEFPPAETKQDPLFGEVQTYHNRVDILLPVTSPSGTVTLNVAYQGCAEKGICYPPMNKTAKLQVPGAAPVADATGQAAVGDTGPLSEQDRLAALLAGDSVWLTLATFFGLGLLLTFTPCVFPMIPILSGIIVGQGKSIDTHKAFVLSLTYVLAMSVTYTAAGYLAGISGESLQVALQKPWVLGIFAGIFVLLALSMFGFYDLQLPSSLQTRITQMSHKQEGGTLVGVAIMGFLSALIVGPCLAPPLAGALIYISQEGSGPLGAMALFALSMGMGLPLVLMGTLEGKFLPKAGAWMNAVKGVFGVLLLGVAIYLLDSVLPAVVIMLLWSALFMVSAVYMGALDHLPQGSAGLRRLWKGLGVVILFYGILLMIGAAGGNTSLLRPLGHLAGSGGSSPATSTSHLRFEPVKGDTGLQQALARTRGEGRPAMLDFYADWCVACKELETYTFADPSVQQAIGGFKLLQTDVTANDALDKELMKSVEVIGPPSILFYDTNGVELRRFRVVGYMPPEAFRAHLEQVSGALR